MKKILGILGGMGPGATAFFFKAVIARTAASIDQEHIRTLIWSDPAIPPRTDAILGTGPSPLPRLLSGVRVLEKGGAGLLVMPCITAHYWADEIRKAARVPFVSLLDETLAFVRKSLPGVRTIGLVASSGTVASGLWAVTFAKAGIGVIAPRPSEQARVMDAISGPGGIKSGAASGRPRTTIVGMARRLVSRGADAIVAGCTEVPLVLRPDDLAVPLIEPMDIGARACVRKAGYGLKEELRPFGTSRPREADHEKNPSDHPSRPRRSGGRGRPGRLQGRRG